MRRNVLRTWRPPPEEQLQPSPRSVQNAPLDPAPQASTTFHASARVHWLLVRCYKCCRVWGWPGGRTGATGAGGPTVESPRWACAISGRTHAIGRRASRPALIGWCASAAVAHWLLACRQSRGPGSAYRNSASAASTHGASLLVV